MGLTGGSLLISRRSFFASAGRLALAAGTGYILPGVLIAEPSTMIDKSRLAVRFANPLNLETPVNLLNTWITPNELFYVRSVAEIPEINLNSWRLQVDGEVAQPLLLTMEDLKKFPQHSVIATLECAGNGRAFFRPQVEGVQWEKGALGTARWTGAKMADVLKKAGIKPKGKHVMMDGADGVKIPAENFVRSIPLEKAMDPDTLLAYQMNGDALPAQHGYPVRVIVPGWTGNHHVKWLKLLRVMDREYEGKFMSGYRVPTAPLAPGAEADSSQMKMITSLPLKSVITSPAHGAELTGSMIRIKGVAYGGMNEISGVDVSTDKGQTWQAAQLLQEQARYAWRLWEFAWQPNAPGSYVILSRAKDHLERRQPILQEWNPSGYLWNVIDHVRVGIRY